MNLTADCNLVAFESRQCHVYILQAYRYVWIHLHNRIVQAVKSHAFVFFYLRRLQFTTLTVPVAFPHSVKKQAEGSLQAPQCFLVPCYQYEMAIELFVLKILLGPENENYLRDKDYSQ